MLGGNVGRSGVRRIGWGRRWRGGENEGGVARRVGVYEVARTGIAQQRGRRRGDSFARAYDALGAGKVGWNERV